MSGNIKCPKCGHEFPMEEAVAEQVKKDLREKMLDYKKQKDEEVARKEKEWDGIRDKMQSEFTLKQEQEKASLKKQIEEQARQAIGADFANQITVLQQGRQEQDEKLRHARERELELMKQQQELKEQREEMELAQQKKMLEERERMREEMKKSEEQRYAQKETEYQMRTRELEKQLEDQKKLAEEMRRRAEQGSMQLQGEVQELALEDMLRQKFPFDRIEEVGKGVKGADCIQYVRNSFAQECGSIIFESKRTKEFSRDWIDKLKADMRTQGADIAVLVSSILPKDMSQFGEKDGIWICNFAEAIPLVMALRSGIMRVHQVMRSQENMGDKMQMLYGYLTSHEFSEQWKAVKEGFMSMKASIDKERDVMEKLWKAREKQLEKVLLNANFIKGSIEGIAGQDNIDLTLLDDPGPDTLPG
jgi:hypothetical protein